MCGIQNLFIKEAMRGAMSRGSISLWKALLTNNGMIRPTNGSFAFNSLLYTIFMDEILRLHKPSDVARQRAERGDINLEQLKETNPTHYKMLVAQNVLEVSPELEGVASDVLLVAFKFHEVFRLEHSPFVTLLVFPELTEKDLERLDTALAKLPELPKFKTQHAYFRIVTDKMGEHRQLALPLSPERWADQKNVLVGPFANQADAEKWGDETVRPRHLIHDAVQFSEVWFCDVFASE
jgi:hypothetical protein